MSNFAPWKDDKGKCWILLGPNKWYLITWTYTHFNSNESLAGLLYLSHQPDKRDHFPFVYSQWISNTAAQIIQHRPWPETMQQAFIENCPLFTWQQCSAQEHLQCYITHCSQSWERRAVCTRNRFHPQHSPKLQVESNFKCGSLSHRPNTQQTVVEWGAWLRQCHAHALTVIIHTWLNKENTRFPKNTILSHAESEPGFKKPSCPQNIA